MIANDPGYRIVSTRTTATGLVSLGLIVSPWQRMSVLVPRKRTGAAELDETIRRSIAARENPKQF